MPLARRIEALRRVIADRQHAVRRLARLLHARAQVVRAAFRPLRPVASFRRARELLVIVHARAMAAAGWDSS
jgi:hypothetical protein